jgi:hypothetical protein
MAAGFERHPAARGAAAEPVARIGPPPVAVRTQDTPKFEQRGKGHEEALLYQ